MKIYKENFELLFKEQYTNLCRYSLSFVHDPEYAREIVQEVFISLWEKRHETNILTSVRSYLYRAVKNKSIDYLRSSKAKQKFEQETLLNKLPDTGNPAELTEYSELEKMIEKALKKLPAKCYTIFSMSRFDNLTNKQIAERLKLSVKTVEAQMTIALRKLKNSMEKFGHPVNQILQLFLL